MEKVRQERKFSLHQLCNRFNKCAATKIHNINSIIYGTYCTIHINSSIQSLIWDQLQKRFGIPNGQLSNSLQQLETTSLRRFR